MKLSEKKYNALNYSEKVSPKHSIGSFVAIFQDKHDEENDLQWETMCIVPSSDLNHENLLNKTNDRLENNSQTELSVLSVQSSDLKVKSGTFF